MKVPWRRKIPNYLSLLLFLCFLLSIHCDFLKAFPITLTIEPGVGLVSSAIFSLWVYRDLVTKFKGKMLIKYVSL